MPRNLTRDRGNATYDGIIRDSLERQRNAKRVRDWANQPYVPARNAGNQTIGRWWARLDVDSKVSVLAIVCLVAALAAIAMGGR
jgi:hypothetical protein